MVKKKQNDNVEEIIKRTYTDPASTGGFAGAEALFKTVNAVHPGISRKDVSKYLEKSRTYTLFKPSRIRFQRLRTVPSGFMSGNTITERIRYSIID